MPFYADAVTRPPRTLTEREQRKLLQITGEHHDGYRDHMMFSLAIGTGLREAELLALNCGDVYDEHGQPRRRMVLRVYKQCGGEDELQEAVLPEAVDAKLVKYRVWKEAVGESVADDEPLFMSKEGQRLSLRMLRHLCHLWQARAGFDRRLGFHSLRHTACSTLYRRTKDIRLTQRFARHASVITTAIYAHPSDQDLEVAVRALPC
jgi:integrase/recombinase XerC